MAELTTQTYSYSDFVNDVGGMKPRAVDIWVIPPLVMFAAWKAKSLNKWVRRSLFSAGIYMIYRNWTNYQQFAASVAKLAPSVVPPAADQVSTPDVPSTMQVPVVPGASLNGSLSFTDIRRANIQ